MNTKKLVSLILVMVSVISFTGCVETLSGVMENVGDSGVSKNAGDFDSEIVIKKFKKTLYAGTKLTGEAIDLIKVAVGHKVEAVKLEQTLKPAIENNESGEIKERFEQQEKETEEFVKDINLKEDAEGAEARKYLGKSLLNITVAGLLDKKCLNYGKLLVEKLPSEIASNPLKAGKFKPVLSFAKTIVLHMPKQIENAGTILKKLTDYATTKGLSPPSESEIQHTENVALDDFFQN